MSMCLLGEIKSMFYSFIILCIILLYIILDWDVVCCLHVFVCSFLEHIYAKNWLAKLDDVWLNYERCKKAGIFSGSHCSQTKTKFLCINMICYVDVVWSWLAIRYKTTCWSTGAWWTLYVRTTSALAQSSVTCLNVLSWTVNARTARRRISSWWDSDHMYCTAYWKDSFKGSSLQISLLIYNVAILFRLKSIFHC